jgi:hypothetical protein
MELELLTPRDIEDKGLHLEIHTYTIRMVVKHLVAVPVL